MRYNELSSNPKVAAAAWDGTRLSFRPDGSHGCQQPHEWTWVVPPNPYSEEDQKLTCPICQAFPAHGLSEISGQRYCHGDYDPSPTCYEKAQSEGLS